MKLSAGELRNSSKRIALNIDPAFRSSAGIEKYTRELIKAICKSDVADQFVFLSTQKVRSEELVQDVSCVQPSIVTCTVPPRLLRLSWSFVGSPSAEQVIGGDPALVHSPLNIRIPTKNCPLLVTIHDVYPTKIPSLLTFRQKIGLTPQMEAKAIRHTAHIIADSENTKQDICTLFDTPSDKITVVPLGVDHDRFKPVVDSAHIRGVTSKYGIDGKFILYVGSLYARKLGKLLEAFEIVCSMSQPQPTLVIVGGRESRTRKETDLRSRIQELGLEGKVIVTGVVPEDDVPVLMSAAELFVYVSFYEGFGLSPLEAMACGAPVVVSKTSSLPEVVGDAGLLVNPSDEHEIAPAIMRVLTEQDLRAQLSHHSLRRAQLFSWDRTVRETFDVYRRVAQIED